MASHYPEIGRRSEDEAQLVSSWRFPLVCDDAFRSLRQTNTCSIGKRWTALSDKLVFSTATRCIWEGNQRRKISEVKAKGLPRGRLDRAVWTFDTVRRVSLGETLEGLCRDDMAACHHCGIVGAMSLLP